MNNIHFVTTEGKVEEESQSYGGLLYNGANFNMKSLQWSRPCEQNLCMHKVCEISDQVESSNLDSFNLVWTFEVKLVGVIKMVF